MQKLNLWESMTKNQEIAQRLTKAATTVIGGGFFASSSSPQYDASYAVKTLNNVPGLINELAAILAEIYGKVEALESCCDEFECGHSAFDHDHTGCRIGVETDEGFCQCSCMRFRKCSCMRFRKDK